MEQNRESINLNKYISSTGICSRRDAEKFIEQGRVTINGKKTQLGNRVFEGDVVKIDGKSLRAKPKTIYIAVNKPVGIVCTTDSKEQKNIVNFVGHPQRLFPIGRLDKPSEGLIFLTNDGDIVNKILRAGNNHEKEYIVTVDKPINDRFIQRMANGIPILGTVTKKCKVEKISDRVFKIILIQGLNRQIRRMCEYLGYEVQRLKRVRIMNVSLDRLKTGEWRELTSKEMAEINKLVASSKKTSDVVDKVSHKNATPRKSPYKNVSSKNKTFRKDQNSEKRFKPKFGRTKK
ncbi:23S rRNA pseudouridine(2604) synthase RluF [Pasteurella skyensis]|uniref:Pseudouridine synthase n=1 Tax=Phocoenobacter skyensis TaxID=97481 RepID=A0AAJ6P2B2_9PAST|nr:23S rRNA pseudouridine(2604) synthase RluF [Pasteurella skyensis]MDP8170469.1 23S rRNA pseudouridine(2604) synthase RluF [Pasteurella skyensis]MDP8174569.1 23S rRNA pseudouridine(2604) synthase RluF [Pasteurella skyensis]